MIRVVGTSIFPPGLASDGGCACANPFDRPAGDPGALRSLARRPPAGFHVPRNTPAHVRVLAHALEDWRPHAALYVHPADPREYLALYEAWQSRVRHSFQVLPVSVAPSTPMRERVRLLGRAYAAVGELIARSAGHAVPAGAEESPGTRPFLRPPREMSGETPSQLPNNSYVIDNKRFTRHYRPPGRRVAVFGDVLLGPDLFGFLRAGGHLAVYVQREIDRDTPSDTATDESWFGHPSFLPTGARLSEWALEMGRRGVSRVVGVYAPFSHGRAVEGRDLSRLGPPAMVLECEIPGLLTASEMTRLENFLV